jgi:SIR2-like domain
LGGWLADEAFEYLIGSPEIDDHIRRLLWWCKSMGYGFEGALAQLQQAYTLSKNDHTRKPLADLQAAIVGMFNEMNKAFEGIPFEPQNNLEHLVGDFLLRFDAIFTLNQDLLLERHYPVQNIGAPPLRKWHGWHMPGLKPLNTTSQGHDPTPPLARMQMPDDPANFREQPGAQPYYKLHGSTNWIGGGAGQDRLLIMGGNKAVEINQYPLLAWYHKRFDEYLAGSTRLMVIGYSFSDAHINQAILKAAEKGTLRLFIIDPQGVDILKTDDLMALNPYIIGASRRPLLTTFGSDRVEHGRQARFFQA